MKDTERSFSLAEWAGAKIAKFDETAAYDAEIEPLARALADKCAEFGIPVLMFFAIDGDEENQTLGNVQWFPDDFGRVGPMLLKIAATPIPNGPSNTQIDLMASLRASN